MLSGVLPSALPPVIVSLSMATSASEPTKKTRLLLLALTVSPLPSGPSMVRSGPVMLSLAIPSSPWVRVMVPLNPEEKVIVSLTLASFALASSMAALKVQMPLVPTGSTSVEHWPSPSSTSAASAVELTLNSAAPAGLTPRSPPMEAATNNARNQKARVLALPIHAILLTALLDISCALSFLPCAQMTRSADQDCTLLLHATKAAYTRRRDRHIPQTCVFLP